MAKGQRFMMRYLIGLPLFVLTACGPVEDMARDRVREEQAAQQAAMSPQKEVRVFAGRWAQDPARCYGAEADLLEIDSVEIRGAGAKACGFTQLVNVSMTGRLLVIATCEGSSARDVTLSIENGALTHSELDGQFRRCADAPPTP